MTTVRAAWVTLAGTAALLQLTQACNNPGAAPAGTDAGTATGSDACSDRGAAGTTLGCIAMGGRCLQTPPGFSPCAAGERPYDLACPQVDVYGDTCCVPWQIDPCEVLGGLCTAADACCDTPWLPTLCGNNKANRPQCCGPAPTPACALQGGQCVSGSCQGALGAGYVADTSAPGSCECGGQGGALGTCCVKALSECIQHGGICAGAGWAPSEPLAPYACAPQPVAACGVWQCHAPDGG